LRGLERDQLGAEPGVGLQRPAAPDRDALRPLRRHDTGRRRQRGRRERALQRWAGRFRLLGTTLGGQVSWLLILAVLGLALAALCVPWRRLDGRGRSLALWGTWLLTAGAFFSVAEFFHPYYTVMLAPAIAALAAIGVATR